MSQKRKRNLLPIFSTIFVPLIGAAIIYAWTEPSQPPPLGNVAAPLNVGTTPQTKLGEISATIFRDTDNPNYFINPSGGISALFSGKVGIGTATPTAKLDIQGGELKIGTTIIKSEGQLSVGLNADRVDGYEASDLLAAGEERCPVFPGTFFENGGAPYYCKKKIVDDTGYVTFQNINEGKICNGQFAVCHNGTCSIVDNDGDGVPSVTDCDDDDPMVGAAADGDCDSDGDGKIDCTAWAKGCSTANIGNKGDCDDNNPNIVNPSDGTCDYDSDGFIDYTALNNGNPNGNWVGWDLNDDSFNTSTLRSGSIVYITTATHNGDFGGPSGLQSFCTNNMPSNLVCNNIHAFVSTESISIKALPTEYGYSENMPLYWYNSSTHKLTKFADNWTDMCDGSIAVSQSDGTNEDYWGVWTGSKDNCSSYCGHTYWTCCHNWTLDTAPGVLGNLGRGSGRSTDGTWLFQTEELWDDCSREYPVRCICAP